VLSQRERRHVEFLDPPDVRFGQLEAIEVAERRVVMERDEVLRLGVTAHLLPLNNEGRVLVNMAPADAQLGFVWRLAALNPTAYAELGLARGLGALDVIIGGAWH
jgi:hypothetical protein